MILNLSLTLNMFQMCGRAVLLFFFFFSFSSSKRGLSSTQRLMKSSDQAKPTGLLGRRWWELKLSFLYSEWKGYCSSVRYEKNIFLWWKCIRSQRSKAIERLESVTLLNLYLRRAVNGKPRLIFTWFIWFSFIS